MENSIKIIKQIESTHKGLGVPLLFGNLCNIAGVSVFFIGEVGTGKGTTVRSIKTLSDVKPEYDMNLFSMNLTTLIKSLGDIRDEKIIWRIPEWSTLLPYHRQVFLTIGSQIISDGNYNHTTRSKDEELALHVENCKLNCFVGIQPNKMSRMMGENENWESLAKDRFLKFALINPLRDDTVESMPTYDFELSENIPELIPIDSSLHVMKIAMKDQCSDERMLIYARRLLKAYCKLEGKFYATIQEEIEFNKLFGIYLKLFSLLSFTTDIDKEEKFAVGTLRLLSLIVRSKGISLYDILDKFKFVDIQDESFRRMIMTKAKILERYRLITVKNSEPTFYMSKELESYYDWYSEISK